MLRKNDPFDSSIATIEDIEEKTEQTVIEKPKKRTPVDVPDLCMTCNHAQNCMYRKNKPEPVVECEEFDGYAISPGAGFVSESLSQEKKSDSRFKGLCVNCAKRETCTFPKAEGGVWHCEDYE